MNELRQTILSEQQIVSRKSRFGLFSQPPPLAVGDNAQYLKKQARRGPDGKPISLPRNMLPGPNRSGVLKKSYIEPTSSIYTGDLYADPEKVQAKYFKQLHTKASFHENQFKPSTGFKTIASSSYKHIGEKVQQKKRPERDESGRVITKLKNITTNPMKRVINDLFKELKYIPDPYERKQMIQAQQMQLSKKKMPQQLFKSMSHGNILFTNHKNVYGFDDKAKQIMRSKSPFVQSAPKIYNHETKFKLARRGHGDPLGKYPEFIAPANIQTLKGGKSQRSTKKEDKQSWRPNGNKILSRPTPSISYSAINIRRHM